MLFLRTRHEPLKLHQPLMWVEEFDFNTAMKLEDCYTKLALAYNHASDKQVAKITEVVWDGKNVYFSAEMKHSYGRFSAYATLVGRLKVNETDNKVYVDCYLGEPTDYFVAGFALLAWLVFLSMISQHTNILIAGLLALIPPLLLMWSDKNVSEEVKGELKYYCRDFLAPSLSAKRYNFKL